MYRVILYSQWKWSRLIVLLGTITGFALPIISLQGAAGADRNPLAAQELLRAVQSWGTLYPVLATTLGLLAAIATWAPDHRGRHIHALSLPLPRWRYVLLRFAAGVTVLVGPIVVSDIKLVEPSVDPGELERRTTKADGATGAGDPV